jgi:hypothetical protein
VQVSLLIKIDLRCRQRVYKQHNALEAGVYKGSYRNAVQIIQIVKFVGHPDLNGHVNHHHHLSEFINLKPTSCPQI